MGAGLSDEALTHELTLSEANKNAERAAHFLTEALDAIHKTL
jgi:hypothetical protein